MNEISKVSEITSVDCAEYMRLDEVSEDDTNMLNNLIGVAKTFIQNYTGRKSEELDNYQDFVIVVFVLVIWVIGDMLLIYGLLRRTFGDINDISRAAKELMAKEVTYIELPPELEELQKQLNYLKLELHQKIIYLMGLFVRLQTQVLKVVIMNITNQHLKQMEV